MAGESKTEKATPKKRRDERKEGNIFFSTDIVSVVCVCGCFYALKFLFPGIYDGVSIFMSRYIVMAGSVMDASGRELSGLATDFAITGVKAALPIMLVSVALAILATGAQTKFLFTGKKIRPKFSNLSPLKGIKKLFSLKNTVELIKNLIKVVILGAILYTTLKDDFIQVVRTMDMEVKTSSAFMLTLALEMVLKVVLIFAAIAAFDYFYQRWEYERQIKMSKHEVKEELKQTEGNPEIKGKIRETQKQRARMRMMQSVPDADVIIKNPTHYAVALRYDIEKNAAPVVVAKGRDELALRIVAVGEKNDVAVIENKPLARGLYASSDIGDEIPAEYYGVIAEILVQVYRLRNKVN